MQNSFYCLIFIINERLDALVLYCCERANYFKEDAQLPILTVKPAKFVSANGQFGQSCTNCTIVQFIKGVSIGFAH